MHGCKRLRVKRLESNQLLRGTGAGARSQEDNPRSCIFLSGLERPSVPSVKVREEEMTVVEMVRPGQKPGPSGQ